MEEETAGGSGNGEGFSNGHFSSGMDSQGGRRIDTDTESGVAAATEVGIRDSLT